MAAFLLPSPLQRKVEALAADLLQPKGAPPVDFTSPPGEPALLPPDSVSWAVFKNPVTLFIGGVAAVLLELAEPRVRHGVWDHSSFRTDPLARLQRTGLAAMVTVYGPENAARAMIAGIGRMHGEVSGVTDAGIAYRADDPELLDWVQATASYGFLEAWTAYVRPLPPASRDRYYAEAAHIAALYGAAGAPRSQAELEVLFDRMRPKLEPSTTIDEFLSIMRRVPALPRAGRPLQLLLIKAAAAILPRDFTSLLKLGPEWRLRGWERLLVQAMARTADRLPLGTFPAVQSCRRLGLPNDYLYAGA